MPASTRRQTMLSGIQPTAIPHLGNYLGAIRNWATLQKDFNYFLFIADWHALTIPQPAEELRENVFKLVAYLLASGIDPQYCTIFIQSHIPEHLELSWILNCMTYMGELNRMTQFKDKSKKAEENLNAGLFSYPVLQAADILIYRAHFVPVGEDQRQHIELTRNLAERFNRRYKKKVLVVPEPYIKSDGGRVMDLQDPMAKMSKSGAFSNGIIFLNDSDDMILRKVKSAVTDSQQSIALANISPGIANLAEIYAILSNEPVQQVLESFDGKMYGQFKLQVAERIIDTIRPIRETAQRYLVDRKFLHEVLLEGSKKARKVARETLGDVFEATGLLMEKQLS